MRGTPNISHTLTGCNYTTSFSKKGKAPPLKLLQKSIEAQIVLRELSTLEEIDENTITTIEGYLCKMYASNNICKVSDLRTTVFFAVLKSRKALIVIIVTTFLIMKNQCV